MFCTPLLPFSQITLCFTYCVAVFVLVNEFLDILIFKCIGWYVLQFTQSALSPQWFVLGKESRSSSGQLGPRKHALCVGRVDALWYWKCEWVSCQFGAIVADIAQENFVVVKAVG